MSPVGVDTIGRPAANASRIETGWLSITEALTKTSASSSSPGMRAGSTRPTKRIASGAMSSASRRSRGSSAPVPATVSVADG